MQQLDNTAFWNGKWAYPDNEKMLFMITKNVRKVIKGGKKKFHIFFNENLNNFQTVKINMSNEITLKL